MGLFEQYPLLLVPYIVAVVVCYDGSKWLIRRYLARRDPKLRL
jgi:hypothetical protein